MNTKNNQIPKIIHQIYIQFNQNIKSEIPDKWIENSIKIQKNNPSCIYKLWTDESINNLIETNSFLPDFKSFYFALKYPIQKVDVIRIFIIYIYGGIYMDLDTINELPIDFDEFYDYGIYLLPSSNSRDSYSNSLIISPKEHQFWMLLLANMIDFRRKWYHFHHLFIMASTGPLMLTNAVKEYLSISEKKDIYTLPSNKYNPCSICDKQCKYDKNKVITRTTHDSSWIKLDSKILNCINCNFKYILIIIVIILLILITFC